MAMAESMPALAAAKADRFCHAAVEHERQAAEESVKDTPTTTMLECVVCGWPWQPNQSVR